MSRSHVRDTARKLLRILPLVMRTVAAELRSAGEFPVPAHFWLLMKLGEQPRRLTELATLSGVSPPTMSNSVSALVERGWVRRTAPAGDRRVVIVEVTVAGRAALDRVSRAAERHIADVLAPLDAGSRRRLQAGLAVLRKVFTAPPAVTGRRPRKGGRARD